MLEFPCSPSSPSSSPYVSPSAPAVAAAQQGGEVAIVSRPHLFLLHTFLLIRGLLRSGAEGTR